MTTYSNNTNFISSTDAGYQQFLGEIIAGLVTNCGLTQTADTGQVTSTTYNAVMTCNAQTATNQLTVNSISAGGNNICIGMQVVGAGIAANTSITAFGTGTGGTGTYTLSSTPGTIAAESMTIQFKAPTGASTSQGYCMLRFNDTLQATSAIYIKLEFGTGGNGVGYPMIWATLGTGSNGSGTITGTTIPKSALCWGNYNGTGLTNYPSYYCYNATQGVAWFAFKCGGTGTGNNAMLGMLIYRSVDNTGAPTSDAVMFLANQLNTTAGAANGGALGIYDYNRSTGTYSTASPNGTAGAWNTSWFGHLPFTCYSSLLGTTAQVYPIYQWKGNSTTPGIGITNAAAIGCGPDWGVLGTTGTITIIGATSLTYIALAAINGYQYITGGSYTAGFAASNACLVLLWQ